jgi:hypothetical protein
MQPLDGNEITLKKSDNNKINTATGIIARECGFTMVIAVYD